MTFVATLQSPPTFPSTDEVFGARGLLARAVPNYQEREGQVTMTVEVDGAFRERRNLLVEGPTGTGKGIAYLVPAIRAFFEEQRRTVVVTSNIALQQQLATKDLPALVRTLRRPFRFALLKGVSNYLCRESLDEAVLDPGSPLEVRDVAGWAQQTQTGDLAESPTDVDPRVRRLVTTTSEDCLGTKCPSVETCFMVRARLDARAAHVVVVNYHLFFADLSLRAEGFNGILPEHDAVVLDELHNAAEIARSFFGRKMTFGSAQHVARRVLNLDPKLGGRLESNARFFFEALERHARSSDYRARLTRHDAAPSEALLEDLRLSAKVLRDEAAQEDDERTRKKLETAADTSDKQAALVRAAMVLDDPVHTVYAVELPDQGSEKSVALASYPIDVAPMLREHLWESPRVGTVVGTSATLGDGKSLDAATAEVGAEAARQVVVPSPFDWRRQALVVVPPGLPPAKDAAWPAAVCDALLEAIEAARGRTLGLFTSRKMLREAHRAVLAARLPYKVLCQGEGTPARLVDEFRRDVNSVLLGTSSLWEGVDVQGESLSCVVIDKLPFDSPDDPVESVLSERSRSHFKRVSLPRAVRRLRQGAGRLIRTATDRGCIVILDERIVSKPYGRKFVDGFPRGTPFMLDEPRWAEGVRKFLE